MSKKLSLEAMLKGGIMVPFVPGRYTIRDTNGNPVARVSGKALKDIIEVSKKKRTNRKIGGHYVIERRSLQKLHGNDWRYKVYREYLKKQKGKCKPCKMQFIKSQYNQILCTK